MNPQCKITIDGKLASGVFMDRLISCDVTDSEGASSDSVSIELNNHPPAAIPRKGALIKVWMGYGTPMAFMGTFTVDEVGVTAFPHTMSVSGRSADMRQDLKSNDKARHWDNKTLGDIVSQIAGEHGLTAKIDEALGAFDFPWIGQDKLSDLEFVESLAREHDAIFAIKDGNMVFVPKGTGKNAAGAPLGEYRVEPSELVVGSAKFTLSDRSGVSSVKASWYDRDEGKLKTVEETADE